MFRTTVPEAKQNKKANNMHSLWNVIVSTARRKEDTGWA